MAYPCLAANGVRCANMTDVSGACNGATASLGTTAFENVIKSTISKIPELSTQQMDCGGKMYSGGFYYTLDSTGKTGYIVYFLKGNVNCEVPGSLLSAGRYQNSNTTECFTSLPSL